MPAKAVSVTATYKDLPANTYAINVQNDGNGTANANVTSATAGTEITLTTNPKDGYKFKEWQVSAGDVTITANKFTMPAQTVTVKAVFEQIVYAVTVNSGTIVGGGTSFATNAPVSITASDAPAGKTFDKWTSADVTFENANNASTTFTMPAKAVTVTATYKDIPATTYAVIVNSGTIVGDGTSFAANAPVSITANAPAANKAFDVWTSTPEVVFENANSASTTFTMPASVITVTANYKDDGVPSTITNFWATEGNGKVDLGWLKPGDGGNEITGYQILCAPDALFPVTLEETDWESAINVGTVLAKTIDELTNGVTYKFAIRAVNVKGAGAESITTATPSLPKISTPSLSFSTITNEHFRWMISSHPAGTTYEVELNGSIKTGLIKPVIIGSILSVELNDALPFFAYGDNTIRVRAISDDTSVYQNSEWSNTVTYTINMAFTEFLNKISDIKGNYKIIQENEKVGEYGDEGTLRYDINGDFSFTDWEDNCWDIFHIDGGKTYDYWTADAGVNWYEYLNGAELYDHETNTFIEYGIGKVFQLTNTSNWTQTGVNTGIYELNDEYILLGLSSFSDWDYAVTDCTIQIIGDKAIVTGTRNVARLDSGVATGEWNDFYKFNFTIEITFGNADTLDVPPVVDQMAKLGEFLGLMDMQGNYKIVQENEYYDDGWTFETRYFEVNDDMSAAWSNINTSIQIYQIVSGQTNRACSEDNGFTWEDDAFYDFETNTFMIASIGKLFELTTIADWTKFGSATSNMYTLDDYVYLNLSGTTTWDKVVVACDIEILEDKVIITGTFGEAWLDGSGAFDGWMGGRFTDFEITITFGNAETITWPL